MATVQVRYIVHDVDPAIEFYMAQLGFTREMHPAPRRQIELFEPSLREARLDARH